MRQGNSLYLILAFAGCSLMAGSHTPIAGQEQPGLEGTLSFIKSKVANYGQVTNSPGKGFEASYVSFEGCTMKLFRRSAAKDCGLDSYSTVELVELDESRVSVMPITKADEWFRILLSTRNNTNEIRFRSKCSVGGSIPEVSETRSLLNIDLDNETVAYRVASAFRHAIELCKRNDPFARKAGH
jgi:hypothetical protein